MWNWLRCVLHPVPAPPVIWRTESFAAGRVRLVVGDITALAVDAIVSADDETLFVGGAVDQAGHRAAGPELLAECRAAGGCVTGLAELMRGYRLPARNVIQAVVPVFTSGMAGHEADALMSCYAEALELAEAHGMESIAFPCLATGESGFPREEACRIAVDVVLDWICGHDAPHEVVFCCESAAGARLYRRHLAGPESHA